jgi:hypothetical protein
VILGAVAAEDDAVGVAIVDVRADPNKLEVGFGHQADVDAAIVVAIDQHHVRIRCAFDRPQQDRLELAQRGTVVSLDDREHVGVDVLDHLCGVLGCLLVRWFHFQLDPADPVGASVGDDLNPRARSRPCAV